MNGIEPDFSDISEMLRDTMISSAADILSEISAENSVYGYPGIIYGTGGYSGNSDIISVNSAGFSDGAERFSAVRGSGASDNDKIVLNADIYLTAELDGKTIAETVTEYQREFNRRSDSYGQ